MVKAQFCACIIYVLSSVSESRSLGWERQLGGIFRLKLNTFSRPIANKYHEGKMQSTLKRGLYAPEPTVLQAFGSSVFAGLVFRLKTNCCGVRSSSYLGLGLLNPVLAANVSNWIAKHPCIRALRSSLPGLCLSLILVFGRWPYLN